MTTESQEPQIIEYASEQIEESLPVSRKKSFSSDFDHFVHGLSLPIYAAIGFSGAVADKVEKTLHQSRKDLQEDEGSFTQKASHKFESRKERFYRQRDEWDAEKLLAADGKNIDDLAQDLRRSTENLLKGFIARGYRVSQAYKNGK